MQWLPNAWLVHHMWHQSNILKIPVGQVWGYQSYRNVISMIDYFQKLIEFLPILLMANNRKVLCKIRNQLFWIIIVLWSSKSWRNWQSGPETCWLLSSTGTSERRTLVFWLWIYLQKMTTWQPFLTEDKITHIPDRAGLSFQETARLQGLF